MISVSKAALLRILKPWIYLLKHLEGHTEHEHDQKKPITRHQLERLARRTSHEGFSLRKLVRESLKRLLLSLISSKSNRDALLVVAHTDFISEIVIDRYVTPSNFYILLSVFVFCIFSNHP